MEMTTNFRVLARFLTFSLPISTELHDKADPTLRELGPAARRRITKHWARLIVQLCTYLKEDDAGVRFRHREEDQGERRRDPAVQNGGAHLRQGGERPLLAGA